MTTLENNPILLSIVVPAYQAERTIRRTVISILELKEESIEVIVVDDGSTDKTPVVLASLAANDPRVKIITQNNRGRSAARNRGVEASSGRWVMFVDADDYLLASGFSSMLERCKTSNASLVVFGMGGSGEGKLKACSTDTCAKIASVSAETFVRAMIKNYVFDIVDKAGIYETNSACARLYRRDLLLRLSVFTDGTMAPFPVGLRFSEDRLLNVAYLRQLGFEPVEFVPVELYFWDFVGSHTCGVLRDGDPESFNGFCVLVSKLPAVGIVSEEEAKLLIARETIGQFQRLVGLARNAEPALLGKYMALFSRPDIVRAVACSPSSGYCCTLFWRVMGRLIGLGCSRLAFKLSVLAFRAKRIVTQG